MSTVIVYATKTGTTKKAAEMLSRELGNCDVINIAEQSFDLSKYDTVIIGSYIRMGTVDRNISKFMLGFIKHLVEIKTAFFICNCFENNAEDYAQHNVPPQLLKTMVSAASFGGELDIKKLRGFDRLAAKAVANADREKGIHREFKINEKSIKEFANKIKAVSQPDS